MTSFGPSSRNRPSDRAHQHQERNQDSGRDICQVKAEAHSISQSLFTQVLTQGRTTVCDFVGARALMVNLLWEVIQGIFKEALCLDSLDDFNMTEVKLRGGEG